MTVVASSSLFVSLVNSGERDREEKKRERRKNNAMKIVFKVVMF